LDRQTAAWLGLQWALGWGQHLETWSARTRETMLDHQKASELETKLALRWDPATAGALASETAHPSEMPSAGTTVPGWAMNLERQLAEGCLASWTGRRAGCRWETA